MKNSLITKRKIRNSLFQNSIRILQLNELENKKRNILLNKFNFSNLNRQKNREVIIYRNEIPLNMKKDIERHRLKKKQKIENNFFLVLFFLNSQKKNGKKTKK